MELILEDTTALTGVVTRTEADGIAIQFDQDNAEQREFVQALVEAEWELREA